MKPFPQLQKTASNSISFVFRAPSKQHSFISRQHSLSLCPPILKTQITLSTPHYLILDVDCARNHENERPMTSKDRRQCENCDLWRPHSMTFCSYAQKPGKRTFRCHDLTPGLTQPHALSLLPQPQDPTDPAFSGSSTPPFTACHCPAADRAQRGRRPGSVKNLIRFFSHLKFFLHRNIPQALKHHPLKFFFRSHPQKP